MDKFLRDLSMTLIKRYIVKFLSRLNLHISFQSTLKSFLDEQDLPEKDPHNLQLDVSNKSKTARCYLCPISKRGFTYYKCLKCNNSMCTTHEASICKNCAED